MEIKCQVAVNKFVMRFLNAKKVKDWSYFKTLGMRIVDAHISLDPNCLLLEPKASCNMHGLG